MLFSSTSLGFFSQSFFFRRCFNGVLLYFPPPPPPAPYRPPTACRFLYWLIAPEAVALDSRHRLFFFSTAFCRSSRTSLLLPSLFAGHLVPSPRSLSAEQHSTGHRAHLCVRACNKDELFSGWLGGKLFQTNYRENIFLLT